MDTSGPLINISVSKPRGLSQQKPFSQLPDRSRVIIGTQKGPYVNRDSRDFRGPAVKFPRAANQGPPNEDYEEPQHESWSAEERSQSGARFADRNYPRRNQQHGVDNRFSPYNRVNQRRSSDHSGAPAFSRDVRTSRIEHAPHPVAISQTASPVDNCDVLSSVPEKPKDVPKTSKAKSKLSIPATSTDVSKNWQEIRKTVGGSGWAKRRNDLKNALLSKAVSSEILPTITTETELQVAETDTFVKMKSFSGLTKTVAMDCEFVGVGPGAFENMLARVSIVNQFGHCIYDTFVKPTELVKDYRTHVSGVRPQNLKKGEDFKVVQTKVAEILKNRVLVGHAIRNDLEVLLLSHPKHGIRDTSRYKPFRVIMKGGTPSLKRLTATVLGVAVQTGEHDSIQDAQAAMRLYTMHKREWESQLSFKGKKLRPKKKTSKAPAK